MAGITSCNSSSKEYYCSILVNFFRIDPSCHLHTTLLTAGKLEVEGSCCFSLESSMEHSDSKARFLAELSDVARAESWLD